MQITHRAQGKGKRKRNQDGTIDAIEESMGFRLSSHKSGLVVISLLVTLTLAGCGGGSMTGQPAAPAVTLSANSLSFPDEAPGGASPAQAVSVRNSGTAPLQIAGISVGANFREIDDCSSPLGVGAQCTINVTFAPTTTGNLQGTVAVTDNAPGSPHNILLTGNGVVSGPPGPPTLTGYCFGVVTIKPNMCALVKDVTSCPVGQVAVQPVFTVGCLPPTSQYVDTSTSCQGKTSTGLTVKGECTVAQ